MFVNIDRTLRNALEALQAEKARIDRRIAAIEAALDGAGQLTPPAGDGARGKPVRRRMSPAARRVVSARMKAYWKKRRAAGKGPAGKGR